MSENPLRYLISFERGAVALLATALDRHGNAEPSKSQSFKVGLTIDRPEFRSKLCEQIAGLFCLYLITFRSFMA
jgi:hypothetical protein